MKRIIYVYSQPRKTWYSAVKTGRMPDHVLYGMSWLHHFGFKTSFSDLGFSKWNLLKWPMSPLQKKFMRQFGIGFQLDQALVLLPQLRSADLIITTNDSCGLPVAFLKYIHLLSTPQIYIHMHLVPNKFISELLRQPQAIISVSSQINLPGQKIYSSPPGVDIGFFKPQTVDPQYDIVAIGRDPGRDYHTLFRAVANLPIKTLIICDPKNIRPLAIPANVTVEHQVSYLRVRQAYHQARIIVLPTKRRAISGQTNFLEALACGKPVIAADTPTLRQSFKQLNQPHCLYYRPEDVMDLKQKIRYFLHRPKLQAQLGQAARKIAPQYSSRKFARKIMSIINDHSN